MIGRKIRAYRRNDGLSLSAESSGWAIAHDLGAISPTTMCRNTTIDNAIVNAMM